MNCRQHAHNINREKQESQLCLKIIFSLKYLYTVSTDISIQSSLLSSGYQSRKENVALHNRIFLTQPFHGQEAHKKERGLIVSKNNLNL